MNLKEQIKDMIKSESTDTQLLSIRLPTTTINQIDELASEIGKTRSDLVTVFISAGIEEVINQLGTENEITCTDLIFKENGNKSKRYFLLNTNYNNSKLDHYKMLENGEASAFYNWRKELIESLKENDQIFLYQSKNGICGYGSASNELIKLDHQGHTNECYTRKLNNFISDFKPITAKSCKDITKSNIIFRNTLTPISIDQGEMLISEIQKRVLK